MRTQTVHFMMVALSFTLMAAVIADERDRTTHQPPFLAPDWTLRDHEGKPHSLQGFQRKRKPVVVIFYLKAGCDACMKNLVGFAKKFKEFEEAGVSLIAISAANSDDLRQVLDLDIIKKGEGVPKPFPYSLVSDADHQVFKAYGVYDKTDSRPLHGTFLIDGDGIVRSPPHISEHADADIDAFLRMAKLLPKSTPNPAPESLPKRIADLESMNRRLQVRLEELESRYDRDLKLLAEAILKTPDGVSLPYELADVQDLLRLKSQVARLDDTTKRFVPNLLGNMQQSKSFLNEVRNATRGRLVLVNDTGADQLLYINGVKWRVRPRKSYAPVPLGPVTVQRPFGPTIQLTDPKAWKVDDQGHYLTFNLQTGRGTRNGPGIKSLDGEHTGDGRNGSNGTGGAGGGHGRGHDDGTRDSRSHGHR